MNDMKGPIAKYYEDKEEFKMQLKVLEDSLDELDKFSAWQGDIANEELHDIKRAVEQIKSKLKPAMKCPQCHKADLVEAKNTLGSYVFQRVVSCDKCSWVYSFNAEVNWRDILEDDLSYLNYSVKEGFDEDEAKKIIKEADWKAVNEMRNKADAYADALAKEET